MARGRHSSLSITLTQEEQKELEQWFSILQRKRFRIANFASKADLKDKVLEFIAQWNQHAHPFNWSTKSVAKVMAGAPLALAA